MLNSNNTGYASVIEYLSSSKGLNINPVTETGDISGVGASARYNIQVNTWYTVEFKVEDNTITARLYDENDNLLVTNTYANTNISDNSNKAIIQSYIANGQVFFKNVSIESL